MEAKSFVAYLFCPFDRSAEHPDSLGVASNYSQWLTHEVSKNHLVNLDCERNGFRCKRDLVKPARCASALYFPANAQQQSIPTLYLLTACLLVTLFRRSTAPDWGWSLCETGHFNQLLFQGRGNHRWGFFARQHGMYRLDVCLGHIVIFLACNNGGTCDHMPPVLPQFG